MENEDSFNSWFSFANSLWQHSCSKVNADWLDYRILLSVISLEKIEAQVNFWFADNHQSFPQLAAMTFGECDQAYPKYPK